LGLFINSRKVIIRYPANSSNANPRGLDDNNIMEPNPQLRQISKNLQMSETDRLLKKATAVEKVLDDLLHDDDDDDPETEVQMMDIDDPLPEKMDDQIRCDLQRPGADIVYIKYCMYAHTASNINIWHS
jgi:hypothetical protein